MGVSESPDNIPGTKKRIKKMSKNSERRLVEYFVVVSSVPRKKADGEKSVEITVSTAASNPHNRVSEITQTGSFDTADGGDDVEFVDDNDFQPVITSRYPEADYEGNPLQESVTCFCYPSGSIRLRTDACMPKVHYFVSTGGKGQQMYGTVLTIYEPYILSATVSPKKKKSENGGDADEDAGNGDDAVEKKKEFYLPKCLVLISAYPYLVAFREYLVQLHRMSKTGDMPLPVERYIVNFCAEIPAPPPGSFEVQTTILDSVIKFWSPPHNQPITWVSLPFSHLFECLDVENIIKVWHCLALERQVLLTSTQLSLLTECCEILLSFLFPMRWSHAYIPVLPHFLIPMLSAPMPYLCGIDKSNLADCLCELSQECVVVDLDSNLVTLGPTTEPLPPLPSHSIASLRTKLEDNVGMVFREARSLTKNDDYSDRGLHLPSHVKMMSDAMWESRLCLFDEAFHLTFTPDMARKCLLNGNDNSGVEFSEHDHFDHTVPIRIMTTEEKEKLRKQSAWDAVQEAFLDMYVYMLRNYRRFLVFPSKDNSEESFASYGGAGFRSKEFVDAQRLDTQQFLNQLVGTQMFDDFITKRLYGSGEADVSFFDMAVDAFLKNSGMLSNVDVKGRIRKVSGSSTSGGGQNGAENKGRRRWRRGSDKSSPKAAPTIVKKVDGPLLQSARVHRKLKTIVPPEPSGIDLPPPDSIEMNGAVVSTAADQHQDADDASVGSTSTSGTQSTKGTRGSMRSGTTGVSSLSGSHVTPRSPSNNVGGTSTLKRRHGAEKEKHFCYMYPSFPTELNPELFGKPRPLPQAVMAEFDRQREDAAKFRRSKPMQAKLPKNKKHIRKGHKNVGLEAQADKPASAEVATFTVFFMAFTAVVGKELLEISDNPLTGDERTIMSTYTHPTDAESSDDDDVSLLTADEDDAASDAAASQSDNSTKDGVGKDHNGDAAKDTVADATSKDDEGGAQSDKSTEDEEVDDDQNDDDAKDTSKDDADATSKDGEGGAQSDNSTKDEEVDDDKNDDDAKDTSKDDADATSKDDEGGAQSDNSTKDEEVDDDQNDDDAKDTIENKGNTSKDDEGGEVNEEEKELADKEHDGSDDEKEEGSDDGSEESAEVVGTAELSNGVHDALKTPKQKNLSNEKPDATSPQKSRFRDTLSDLQIEEAKATSRAQLGLAFEMLEMMKKRGLKADPDTFQYLIDACGRCGDTERATKLLARMHEDGIVADGVVYSWLVTAFSSESAWRKLSGKNDKDLPDWANGASVEMDWNKLQKRSVRDRAKESLRNFANEEDDDLEAATGLRKSSVRAVKQMIRRRVGSQQQELEPIVAAPSKEEKVFVSEAVLRQILLGESLLEIVYPDISIDTDNELCPRCNKLLTDDEVVAGWAPGNSQEYTTKCPICPQKFVPHFCVQSTSPSFKGSKGTGTPLLCERLSPWVLQKELRSVMSDREGIEELLDPEWREQETKNAILWWNLILSCMRYRFPFTFLLQGSFGTNLIAPTPVDDEL